MSNDQENFLKYLTNSNTAYNMSNFDELYKVFNYFKFNSGAMEPKNDLFSLFLYLYQYQFQQQLYQESFERQKQNLPSECKTECKPLQKDTLNTTDLLKQSIDKIFTSDKPKRKFKEECSCGASFDSCETYKLHLKQTNHKRPVISPMLSNDCGVSHKMVRGQEEWVNNSRNNNFISQILKCLECSTSFDTLDDLSLHMLKSNHFSKFHPNQSVINSTRSASPSLKKPCTNTCLSVNNKSKQTLTTTKSTRSNIYIDDKSRYSQVRNMPSSDYKKLTCKICKKIFHEQSSLPPLIELIQHLKKVHSINYICTNCGEFFDNSKDLNEHLVEYHKFNNVNLNNKKSKIDSHNSDVEKKEICKNFSSSSSCSSSNSNSSSPSSFIYENSKEKQNHPLLALQMFVNGTTELETQSSPKQYATIQKSPVSNSQVLETISKLPAKKRPYLLEESSEENDFDEHKKVKYENTFNETKKTESTKQNSTQSILNTQNNSHIQPLNLLQNMRFCLDEYLSR